MMKTTAEETIVRRRPSLSAAWPAMAAPKIAPTGTALTTIPCSKPPRSKSFFTKSSALAMIPVS
jgi:hypothetical protein